MSWYELRLRLKGYATVLTGGFAVFYGPQLIRGGQHTALNEGQQTFAMMSAQAPADCDCHDGW